MLSPKAGKLTGLISLICDYEIANLVKQGTVEAVKPKVITNSISQMLTITGDFYF